MKANCLDILLGAAVVSTASGLSLPQNGTNAAMNGPTMKNLPFFDCIQLGYKAFAEKFPQFPSSHRMSIMLRQTPTGTIDWLNKPIDSTQLYSWLSTGKKETPYEIAWAQADKWGKFDSFPERLAQKEEVDFNFDFDKVKASGLDVAGAWKALLADPHVQAAGASSPNVDSVQVHLVVDPRDGKIYYKFQVWDTKSWPTHYWWIWVDLKENVKIMRPTRLAENAPAVAVS